MTIFQLFSEVCDFAQTAAFAKVIIVLQMLKNIAWSIHNSDGSYIGQSKAFAEQVAFVQCMSLKGLTVAAADMTVADSSSGPLRITYRSEDFIVEPAMISR